MRKLIAALSLVVLAILALSSTVVGQAAVPTLTAWDQSRAAIVNDAEIAATDSTARISSGVTRDAAIAAVGAWIDVTRGARIWSGRAAQFEGEPEREVIVVVVGGGIFPFGGPMGEEPITQKARLSGVILDATTGEFLRGFILS